MYYIRADANEKIGTGHVMRCLTIAEELRIQGENVTFIIADDCSRAMIEEHDFSVICLNSVWNHLEMELPILISAIKQEDISKLLIDSYFVTEKYFKTLRLYAKLFYIDDLNRFLYPVDLLINYNIYAEDLAYEERYRRAGISTKFALGCRYAPLRKEFDGDDKQIHERASHILITSGGTDPYNIVGNILEGLSKKQWFSNVNCHVVLGRFNVNKGTIKKRWIHCPNVFLLENVSNMAEHMRECDIAVTAGGVTVYELCAVGIPSIMYTLADNQLKIAETISNADIIPWAGDVRDDEDKCINSIINNIEYLLENCQIRKTFSKRMRELVDGKGCKRLVNVLQEYDFK